MFPGATEAHALLFATTNYEADEDGTLHAVLPSRCVYATGKQTCAMFVDHYRKRKTGPCYPVAVVGCRVHGRRRYTLYPAGHYPYGLVAVVPYSAGGELLLEADSGGPPWQATLFGAAQDAAQGQMWPSEQNWWQRRDARRRRTQGRRLEMDGRLTGVSGGLEEREREQIATRLGVATMTVISGARRWGRSWQSRGAAIVAIKVGLGELAMSRPLYPEFARLLQEHGFQQLAISYRHASEVARLPWHHRDPFDRLLIAQASVENLPIVSVDEAFDDYAVTRLW